MSIENQIAVFYFLTVANIWFASESKASSINGWMNAALACIIILAGYLK